MNSEQLRKVLSPLKTKKDKVMPRIQNDLLVCFCQWVHVDMRERRMIDGEDHNLNAGNLTDCAYK